jgi:hypothetical protein
VTRTGYFARGNVQSSVAIVDARDAVVHPAGR